MSDDEDIEALTARVAAARQQELEDVRRRLGRHRTEPADLPAIENLPKEPVTEEIEDAEIVEVEDSPPEPAVPVELVLTMRERVVQMVDEYLAADKEITHQEVRLIELRGGKENLTDDDQLLLNNLRDFVLQQYEQLLET